MAKNLYLPPLWDVYYLSTYVALQSKKLKTINICCAITSYGAFLTNETYFKYELSQSFRITQ